MVRGRHLLLQGPRKADVGEIEGPVLLCRGVEELSDFGQTEGHGPGCADGRSRQQARVGGESRGDVDGKDRKAQAVDEGDGVGNNPPDGWTESGTEKGVDDERRTPGLGAGGFKGGLVRDSRHPEAASSGHVEVGSRAGFQVLERPEEKDRRLSAHAKQVPSRHQAVAAVVPLAAEDGDLAAAEVPEHLHGGFGHRAARILHEGQGGNAEMLRCLAVHGRHFHGREEFQRFPPVSRRLASGPVCGRRLMCRSGRERER
jgi:hypothetical protein